MKNKNLALVAVLFTISVIMAFANGPTPQVVIDTDQIIDGAVTILKTDGVAANDLSNVTPATGRAALGLGTMAVATATDYVATSALALRLDTGNASFTGDIDVTGDVGAATLGITGHSKLTTASATVMQMTDIKVNHGSYTRGRVDEIFEMADGGVATFGITIFTDIAVRRGFVKFYNREAGREWGEVYLDGGTGATKICGHADVTITYNNAGTINIANTGNVNEFVVQNNSGALISLGMSWFGAE